MFLMSIKMGSNITLELECAIGLFLGSKLRMPNTFDRNGTVNMESWMKAYLIITKVKGYFLQ